MRTFAAARGWDVTTAPSGPDAGFLYEQINNDSKTQLCPKITQIN